MNRPLNPEGSTANVGVNVSYTLAYKGKTIIIANDVV